VWEKASTYLRQAGGKAFARSTHRQSATFLEEALVALRHQPQTSATLEQAIDVRLALRNSLFPLGEFETGLGHLRDAEGLAKELGDQRRLAWIAAYMSEHARLTGHATDARTFAQSALTIAERLGDFPLRIAGNYYLGTAWYTSGDYRQADEIFPRILELLQGNLIRERCGLAGFPAPSSNTFWAWALAERGEFDRGMACGHEAVRLAEMLDHPFSLVLGCEALTRVHGVRGELDQAIRWAERGLAVSRDWKIAFHSAILMDFLGHAYVLSGRLAEGISLLQQALMAMESMGLVMFLTSMIVHLGEAYVIVGRLDDALAAARRGLELARERGHRGVEAWALRLLGEIASHSDIPDVDVAQDHYHQALALADELDMRPLVAHSHFGLSRLYHRADKRKEAQEHLTIATTQYGKLGMQLWLQRAAVEVGS
jgi:tetratricopeptide (TPR) repeat protein